MIRSITALSLVLGSVAQCGPDKSKPYPPGSTTCPAGPKGGSTGGSGGGKACTNPTCASPPCAAALLGDVGCTTVAGKVKLKHELLEAGAEIAANAHIFGPFEAGFTEKQKGIIEKWGCADASKVYDSEGGKDIGIAERHLAHMCNMEFPRIVGTTYYGVVGQCGGHTGDYHFHRSFSCLYKEEGTHSTKVGIAGSWNVYGKWEDYSKAMLPYLDACGGHLGKTPESPSADVYHYHVQDRAPFTIGCHGPSKSGGLVDIATCRSLYSECGDGDIKKVAVKNGTVDYDIFCPCYDADGSNVGTKELPAISAKTNSFKSTTVTTTVPTSSGPSGSSQSTTKASGASTASGATRSVDFLSSSLLAFLPVLCATS